VVNLIRTNRSAGNLFLFATATLIWGSTWYVQKFQIGSVDSVLSVAYRFGLAALVMAALGLATGKFRGLKLTRAQHAWIALQGFLLFFLNYWMFYQSTHYITSGLVAVCFAMLSLMNAANQRLLFGIKFRPQVVAGGIAGVIGVIGVFWHDFAGLDFSDTRILGIGLALLATFIASLGNIAALRNSRDQIPIFPTITLAMAWGALISFAAALLSGASLVFDTSLSYVGSLLYLTILGSVIAFQAYLNLVARIGADKAGFVGILTPVIALTISTFLEDYIWTWQAVLGMTLILAGNAFALTNPERLRALLNFRKESGAKSRA
jgi:drug/metabolite transporter (DMT)-like permease